MSRALEEWSRDELIAAIRTFAREPRTSASPASEEAVLHDLRVHQIELEMQNRELRESQHQLEESRSRYADLYDLAPVGYCTIDRSGVVREANIEAARLLGTNRAYLTGRPLSAVVTTDLRRLRAHIDDCLTRRERVTCELELRRNSGGNIVVQMVSTPLALVGAAASACRTTLTDISDLKSSEERLRLLSSVSERLVSSLDYRATLPAVAALMVPLLADLAFIDVYTVDQRIERFSRRGVDPIGDYERSPQAEVLRTLTPLFVVSAQTPTLRAALGVSASSEPAVAQAAHGSLMLVPLIARGHTLGVLTFVFVASGRTYSAAEQSLANEVAARVTMAVESAHLYESAQEAIHAREDIVAVVSHDLYNPLHGMRLNCEHLLESAPPEERRSGRKQLEAIRRGIDRMAHMIRQLSEMARIEAGHLTLERVVHPIDVLVGDALDLIRPLAEKKQMTLRAPSSLPAVVVSADRDRILQVLSNVVGNAIKFSPAGGTVTLDATVDGGFVRFAVTDQGPGIAREQMVHIFERYWRAEERRRSGSGLGLYIAKSIVEAHGGQIGVDSELERGTTVWFKLSIAADGEAGLSLGAQPARRSVPEAPVLVVDDDPEMREALFDALSRRGFHATQAANGDEALRYLRSGARKPCLILLDLKMPLMDGWTMQAQLGADPSLASIPLLLVSDDVDVERHAATMGVHGYLRKPINVETLLFAVKNYCVYDN
jgi:PAS domain S-box-containing protein